MRDLDYLGEANIFVENETGEYVDIRVQTRDQWSTLLSYILSQGGGRTIFGGAVEEFNLLGYGKRVYGEVRHEVSEGTQYTLTCSDPQVFGNRWIARQTFIHGRFIESFRRNCYAPFFHSIPDGPERRGQHHR